MSTAIELSEDSLTVHIEGADRLWALKSQLRIPLVNVLNARPASDEASEWLHGIRLGGTHVPGVLSAGRFYSHGELVFWDVHEPYRAIALELRDERYDRLVIDVASPVQDVIRIREALAVATAPAR